MSLLALALSAVAAATPSTAVGVGLDEFHVALYRTKVKPGVVRFNARNLGEDPHDLAIRSPGGRVLKRLPVLLPGERATLTIRLRMRGSYRMICTLPQHEARGMRATLRVVKRL
jgi:plastocyanin